jgi:hypothetical protein
MMNQCSKQVTPSTLVFSNRSASTMASGLLETFGFVWISLCRLGQRSQTPPHEAAHIDARYEEAQLCRRHHHRCVYCLLIIGLELH